MSSVINAYSVNERINPWYPLDTILQSSATKRNVVRVAEDIVDGKRQLTVRSWENLKRSTEEYPRNTTIITQSQQDGYDMWIGNSVITLENINSPGRHVVHQSRVHVYQLSVGVIWIQHPLSTNNNGFTIIRTQSRYIHVDEGGRMFFYRNMNLRDEEFYSSNNRMTYDDNETNELRDAINHYYSMDTIVTSTKKTSVKKTK